MKRIFRLFLIVAVSCEAAWAQNPSIDEIRRMFDYDQNAPVDVKEVTSSIETVFRYMTSLTRVPKSGRVSAYLVVPAEKGRFAGVVFGHWGMALGPSFLPEAMLYAQAV
jgi:hypothetical protein